MKQHCARGLALATALVVLATLLYPLPLASRAAYAQDVGSVLDPYPLRPPDTSSPRDTLRSFHADFDAALRGWRAGVPRETSIRLAERALDTFDFSRLAERDRAAAEIEAALFLMEILDRIEIPAAEEIPGAEAVADTDRPVTSWTIPNTRITIAQMAEGPRAGEFLFTAETVERLGEYYARARDLPYKPDALVDIYEDFNLSPGTLVPRSWAAALPAWSMIAFLEQAVWQWFCLVLIAVAAFLLVRWLYRLGRRWDARHMETSAYTRFGKPIAVAAGIFVVYASGGALSNVVRLTGEVWGVVSFIIWAMYFFGVGWFAVLVANRIAGTINEARQVREGSIDSQLVRILLRLFSLVFVALLIVYAADFFGIPITPVAASLGVGGLAVALAVRPTLENIIGGMTLFADKPVRIGDFCRFGEDYSTVEEIGLRSTRIRKFDDTVVSVPNADLSQRELTNLAKIRQRLYRTTLGLRFETTPEQLRYVLAQLREMLLGHPKVSPDWLYVRFVGFGAYSLDIKIYAYIRANAWLEYGAIREDVSFRIMDIVREAGTGFAFPSQTTYLGRDGGLDDERGREAEMKVQDWRSQGQLPFPDFDPNAQREKEDTLDYPPAGSPDYRGKDRAGHGPAAPGAG